MLKETVTSVAKPKSVSHKRRPNEKVRPESAQLLRLLRCRNNNEAFGDDDRRKFGVVPRFFAPSGEAEELPVQARYARHTRSRIVQKMVNLYR
jgi:hypothetical protein